VAIQMLSTGSRLQGYLGPASGQIVASLNKLFTREGLNDNKIHSRVGWYSVFCHNRLRSMRGIKLGGKSMTKYTLLLASFVFFSLSQVFAAEEPKPNNLQQLMLYRSAVQDSSECRVLVIQGNPVFVDKVAGSAASTCPDAFAWVQLAKVIKNEFWNWGLDQTTWPQEPWPLCKAGDTNQCCPKGAKKLTAAEKSHCPYSRTDFKDPGPLPAQPNGRESAGVINHRGLDIADKLDPGRLLRDLELELVFRNKPMINYIIKQNLYNKEGLGNLNKQQNEAITSGKLGVAQTLQVRFPVDSIMLKADFVHREIMLNLGLIQTQDKKGKRLEPPQNPDHPYVTVQIEGTGAKGDVPGLYYLVAMTNASKALPAWHWFAMEHVANKGRCDYIGCNDSFGYNVNGSAQPGADFGSHFIPPKIILNNDRITMDANSPLFDLGKVYLPEDTGEKISAELKTLLKGMGVGTGRKNPDPRKLSATDPAWLNYRLKGSQSAFTTTSGVPTGTGATVTEGGFVNSASCITCHSQAAVDGNGNPAVRGVGGTWRPNLFGYQQVVMGAPDMDWFYNPGTTEITGTQIDFVWGILNANCIDKSSPGCGK